MKTQRRFDGNIKTLGRDWEFFRINVAIVIWKVKKGATRAQNAGGDKSPQPQILGSEKTKNNDTQ